PTPSPSPQGGGERTGVVGQGPRRRAHRAAVATRCLERAPRPTPSPWPRAVEDPPPAPEARGQAGGRPQGRRGTVGRARPTERGEAGGAGRPRRNRGSDRSRG